MVAAQADPVAAVVPPHSGITGVHLAGLDLDGTIETRIFYATSPDGQTNWSVRTVEYADPNAVPLVDKPYISVWDSFDGPDPPDGTPRYICITWTQITIQTGPDEWVLRYALSIDGGETFEVLETLDDITGDVEVAEVTMSASAFAPGPAQDPYLYIVWHRRDRLSGVDRIVWRRGVVSQSQGQPSVAWLPPLTAPPGVVAEINNLRYGVTPDQLVNFAVSDQPSIAVDHTCVRAGWVYVCYASEIPAGLPGAVDPDTPCQFNTCQPDIFVSRYQYDPNDADVNDFLWETVRVNDDEPIPLPESLDYMQTVQVMPWVALNDRGRVGVGFYDRRLDRPEGPGDQDYNKLQWYYFAYSVDGAGTFRTNMQVSDVPSDTRPDDESTVIMGDYTSLGPGPDGLFYGLWDDTRNFNGLDRHRIGDIYFDEIAPKDVPPDFDGDCDVDLDDFGTFGACYNGANRPPAASCPVGIDADFDGDCDVDLDDFARLSACYNGANQAPAPGCEWDECDGGGEGAMPPAAPDGQARDEPTAEQLYWLLYEYCEENGIPFT